MTTLLTTRGTTALILVPGIAGTMMGIAWLYPALLPGVILALLAFGVILLACRHLTAAWAGWLLVTGLSLEMALTDLIGPDAFQITIAVTKATEIGLVALTILRLGVVPDRFNPAWAFVAMGATGAIAGVHPGLTMMEMARSLVGDVTPFLLFFCVKPAGWGPTVLRAVTLAPLLSVAYWALCWMCLGSVRYSSTAADCDWPGSAIRRFWPASACPRSMPD